MTTTGNTEATMTGYRAHYEDGTTEDFATEDDALDAADFGGKQVSRITKIQQQVDVVAAVAPELLSMAKAGPGGMYKPDASPTKLRCARCGRPAMWIAGAGEALCHRHQDDY
jgi:hypothetical protein